MSDNSYNILIKKLDEFIRKYYLNQLVRGILFSTGILLSLFLIANLLEYFLKFDILGRKIIFYGFVLITGLVTYPFIFIPLKHYLRLGKVISYEQAAKLIGIHFSEVQDKLLNILLLEKMLQHSKDITLLLAGIEQKINNIKPIPFIKAINFSVNKKYARYAAIPFVIIITLLFTAPGIIKEPTERIIYNNIYFAHKAPYQLIIKNRDLQTIQYEDFDLLVEAIGTVIPKSVEILWEGRKYSLSKNKDTYRYKFKNLQTNLNFALISDDFIFGPYTIEVLPKPIILEFNVQLDYPGYINKKDEFLENTGDLTIPEGTKVTWMFNTDHVDNVFLNFRNEQLTTKKNSKNEFVVSKRIKDNTSYTVLLNGISSQRDSVQYSVNVIKDAYPSIKVEEFKDSITNRYIYFNGEAADDYAITGVFFKYLIKRENIVTDNRYLSKEIFLPKGLSFTYYDYLADLDSLNLRPGDEFIYYFEVWDNDEVNGKKSTKTNLRAIKIPTKKELETQIKNNNKDIKNELSTTVDEAKKLKDELQKMQEKILQKQNLDWEDRQQIKEAMDQQKNLYDKMQSLQDKFSNNLKQQEKFRELSESIRKKQEALQEIFENSLSEEMKEMIEKLESLLDKLNSQQMMEQLESFELTAEETEEELDKILELFKKLEFEQKLDETINDLEDLAKQQDDLRDKTLEKESSNEEIQKGQEDIKEQFEDIQQKMSELNDLQSDKKEEDPLNTEQKSQETKKQLDNSLKELQNNKNKKAAEEQKNASDNMKSLAKQLSDMKGDMQSKQQQLDIEAIRQLLENLVKVSFDQEKIMEEVKTIDKQSPRYVELIQEQFKLQEDVAMIKDSVLALSKRIFQIKSFVDEQVRDLNRHIINSISSLEARDIRTSLVEEQNAMTAMNNLALMLSEILKSLQDQMANQMPGDQMCQNPGGSNPNKQGKMPKMGDMQKQLNEQIKQLEKSLKEGKNTGEQQGMSKQLAKAAQKQAQLRQMLEQFNREFNKDGKDSYGDLEKLLEKMEQTEEDIVNKNITDELLNRQQEILTRLLEAEEAERERDKDNEREAKSGGELEKSFPPEIEEYLKKKKAEAELYKKLPPSLKPYYKEMVQKYLKDISF